MVHLQRLVLKMPVPQLSRRARYGPISAILGTYRGNNREQNVIFFKGDLRREDEDGVSFVNSFFCADFYFELIMFFVLS